MGGAELTRIAIIVGTHGRGSNMRAIHEACHSGVISGEVSVVIAPSLESPAIETAKQLGLSIATFDPSADLDGSQLLSIAARFRIDLICLAGYMKLIPLNFVRRYEGAILNIHPALLPKYSGKGMYGMKVHEAVLSAGDKESGCTVHFVNENYDEGASFHQLRCDVLPNDSPESLAARVLTLEHQCCVEAISKWIELNQSGRNASL